jgi:hypothetical protein
VWERAIPPFLIECVGLKYKKRRGDECVWNLNEDRRRERFDALETLIVRGGRGASFNGRLSAIGTRQACGNAKKRLDAADRR